jgi:hypothetical protein
VLDLLSPEPGAFYVMDRGCLDFERLYALQQAGSFFVTRAKSNLDARRIYSAPTDRTTGVICDLTIALNGHCSQRHYPEHFRRIRFKDAETGKTLVFLTNHTTLPAATICALYKVRWQVELFFKWMKQHLRIKQFYGTSENAVKSQIWIAVSVYVLVAIVLKRLDIEASLYTLLQILSVTVFEKMPNAPPQADPQAAVNARRTRTCRWRREGSSHERRPDEPRECASTSLSGSPRIDRRRWPPDVPCGTPSASIGKP